MMPASLVQCVPRGPPRVGWLGGGSEILGFWPSATVATNCPKISGARVRAKINRSWSMTGMAIIMAYNDRSTLHSILGSFLNDVIERRQYLRTGKSYPFIFKSHRCYNSA
jgi:hypothetical protein